MCGIIGVLRFGELGSPAKRASALYLATSLLESSETRGKDATGVATLFDNGNFFVQKMGISATEFVSRSGGKPDDFEGLMAVLRNYTDASMRCLIGHCRKKSAGGLNNVDNHPIKAGNIIGVHNGTLKNDDVIFKNLNCERDGKVDSEAIMRLLQFFTKDCSEPFTVDTVEETCTRLEGTFSILAFNANNPNQVVSARDGRPAEYCLIKPLGLVLVASEKKFIDRAIWKYNQMARLFPTGNPDNAFVALKKDDVSYEMLAADSVAVFNLTKTITAETKLKDLYETKKLPLVANRLWKTKTATTTNYGTQNNYANRRQGAANNTNTNTNTGTAGAKKDDKEPKKQTNNAGKTGDTKGTAQSGSDKGSTSKTQISGSPAPTGRVWNTALNRFVQVFGKKDEVKNGTVLDTEKKTRSKLGDAVNEIALDAVDLDLAEGKKTKGAVPKGTGGSDAKVDEQLTESKHSVEAFTTSEMGAKVEIVAPVEGKSDVTVVDLNDEDPKVDPGKMVATLKEGIEKGKNSSASERAARDAAILAAKSLNKFETVYEIAEFVGTDATSLKQLPMHSMANRLIKHLFCEFYTRGWLDAQAKKVPDNSEKVSRAQKHIRVLKTVNSVIDSVLNDKFVRESGMDDEILGLVAKWTEDIGNKSELSPSVLDEIFNVGDYRGSRALRRIASSLKKLN